jgi:putative ABC transport system substrate-binding protein
MAIDIVRREFLAGLWGTAVTWPVAQAQQLRGTTPRIGVLWHASNEQEEATYLGAFRQDFRDVGYVEGQTIILENRFAGEQYDRFDALPTTQQRVA